MSIQHPKRNLNMLKCGLILTVYYTDKKNIRRYAHLAHGKTLKKLYPKSKYDIQKIYDFCLKKEFNLDDYTYDTVMYPLFLQYFNLDDICRGLVDLLVDEKYIKKLKKTILLLKNALQKEYKKEFLNLKKEIDYNDIDLYILRFYPKKPKNKKNIIDDLKKDINEKYFIALDQNEEYISNKNIEAVSRIPAFSLFGISEKNTEIKDPIFLGALKRKWFNLIEKEKNNLIKNFESMDISFMSEKEKEEFNKEFIVLKEELNKINIKDLDNCKTPKDVIRYWPSILQPEPAYVYGN